MSMQRKRTEVDVVDVQQRHQLENQFADALKQMREENDDQILAMRTETETMYQKKASQYFGIIHSDDLIRDGQFLLIHDSR